MEHTLVFCFASAEGPSRASLESLAAARQINERLGKGQVQALLIGDHVEQHATTLAQCGADEVFIASDARLHEHAGDLILGVLETVVKDQTASIVLLPQDDLGGEIGPRLAYRLQTGIITDCTGFDSTDGQLRWLRPVYGGKAMAYMVASGVPHIITMRSRAFEPLPADPARQGALHKLDLASEAAGRVTLVEKVQHAMEGLSVDQAQVIVSGGRGMEDPEGFKSLSALAGVLGAAVGGSRPAADLGWIPHSQLIGQTGKIVAPNLYIAVAISGAPQHMAGAGSSKTIVAINKDEDAPIFKQAHIGVIEEWQKVLPALVAACKELAG